MYFPNKNVIGGAMHGAETNAHSLLQMQDLTADFIPGKNAVFATVGSLWGSPLKQVIVSVISAN